MVGRDGEHIKKQRNKQRSRRGGSPAPRGSSWLLVSGSFPEYVKAAMLRKHCGVVAVRHVHAGREADLRRVEGQQAALGFATPDAFLGRRRGGDEALLLARLVRDFADELSAHPAAGLVVFDDSEAAVAASLVARRRGVRVARVEAGMRSGGREPDELRRILLDESADLLFCSTASHSRNLPGRRGVHPTGDLLADLFAEQAERLATRARRETGEYAVLAVDRMPPQPALEALARVGMRVVFPAQASLSAEHTLPTNVEHRPALRYLGFLGLLAGARLVLTDSAQVQKEAYLAGARCVTFAHTTRAMETVDAGWNVLTGFDPRLIVAAARERPRMPSPLPIYGEGGAATRIAGVLAGGRVHV